MSRRPGWDNQFAETEGEQRERWRRIKADRKANGLCWQCARPIDFCDCPNVDHAQERCAARTQAGKGEGMRKMDTQGANTDER